MLRRNRHISRHIVPGNIARMATWSFNLPNTDPIVPVSVPSELKKDELLEFPAFKRWITTLEKNLKLQESNKDHEFHSSPYKLRKIDIQSVDRFGGGKRLGFVKLKAEIKNDEGEHLPGSVFLRGPSVGMMVILQPDDVAEDSREEKHVLLTLQPRIPAGSLAFPELPAGMVDDSGTFAGAAAKEIKEELGLDIPESELTNLTELAIPLSDKSYAESLPQAVFPSGGGSDEYIPIFLHQKRVPRGQLQEWTGKLTGLRAQGEKITLKLVKLEDLWKEGGRDAKAIAAWGLYMGLRGEGKL